MKRKEIQGHCVGLLEAAPYSVTRKVCSYKFHTQKHFIQFFFFLEIKQKESSYKYSSNNTDPTQKTADNNVSKSI